MHDNHVCPLCQNMSLTEVWHAKTRWLMIAIKCPTSAVGGGGGGGGIQEKPTSKEQRNVCLLSSLCSLPHGVRLGRQSSWLSLAGQLREAHALCGAVAGTCLASL